MHCENCEFKKLTLNDEAIIRNLLNGDSEKTCDFTLGGVFIWRDYFDTYYLIYNDTLILKNVYDGRTTFSVPQGSGAKAGLEFIKSYCKSNNIPLVFNTVNESDLELLKGEFSLETCDVIEDRDRFDYLYSADSLSTFSGRKYNGQRNHINNFTNTYPNYGIIPINAENIGQLTDFLMLYKEATDISSKIFTEEINKVHEVLNHNDLYCQEGVMIKAGGEIVAFAMGEAVGDTLYVHIEKALSYIRGAYQMIVREFVCHMKKHHNIVYVNREDDLGDEGLRRSKLSYHPVKIIEKYSVSIK